MTTDESRSVRADDHAASLEAARARSADPRRWFDELLAEGPVHVDDRSGAVQLLRRDDIQAALKDHETFSSQYLVMGSTEPIIPLNVDPPEHVRYRRLLDPLFAPRRMAELQPTVEAHVNDLIDGFIDAGECDFAADLAVPLPCSTFLSLLGIPLDELDEAIRRKDIMIRADTMVDSPEEAAELQATNAAEVYGRFAALLEERRADPRDDLVTYLTTAEIDGDRLTDSEILRTCFLLFSAGLDTVTISLECIFNHLLVDDEARRMVVDEPETQHGVIEELLRWETPVQGVTRRVTRDVDVSGHRIPAGTQVSLTLASANTDPAHPGARQVELRREDKRHLAFGGGAHRCLGSHLARMELRTVVRVWHERIPEYAYRPGTEVVWNGSALRGIDHMPIVWPTEESRQR